MASYVPPHCRTQDGQYNSGKQSHGHGSQRHMYYQQNSVLPKPEPLLACSQSTQSTSTYEAILNKTLLFFVEKLVERSPRTLHDLSCQFGQPGFTREMRAIVGNSQHGLRKFLSLHPYLFTINSDDTVMYTPLTGNNNNAVPSDGSVHDPANQRLDKDTLQAIEYFQKRLLQYGSNVRVPIKSLQGHRSQAPLVIRHVTGQQLDTFISFLKKHSSVFAVEGDFVWLVSNNNNNYSDSATGSGIGNLNIDFKELSLELNDQIDTEKISCLIRFVQSTIEENGPMLVEQLFHRIGVQFDETDQQMFKTPNDLATFLKMQNVFQVHSNLVTLTFVPQLNHSNSKLGESAKDINSKYAGKISPDLATKPLLPKCQDVPNLEPFQRELPKVAVATFGPTNQQLPQQRRPYRNVVNNVILQTINANAIDLPSDNIVIITNVRKGRQIVESSLQTSQALGLDCEGVNLGPDGKITLVQIGTSSNRIYIFDMLVEGMNDVLKPIIESETIVKVMHDCRNDSINLYNQYGIMLVSVFDTQVAYTVTKCKTKNISLNSLCAELNLEGNQLKDKVKSIYRHDPQYWLRRPLTKQMLNYASSDVTSLLQIYAELNPLICDREVFNDLCIEQINILIQPNEIRQKKRLRKNQQDVKVLAEKFKTSKPSELSLTNREIRLVKYLNLPPETVQQLPMKIYKKMTKTPIIQQSQSSLSQLGSGGSNYSDNEFNSLEPCSLDSLISSLDLFLEKSNAASALSAITIEGGGQGTLETYTDCEQIHVHATDVLKLIRTTCEVATQTISTGDIPITKVYVDEEDELKGKKFGRR